MVEDDDKPLFYAPQMSATGERPDVIWLSREEARHAVTSRRLRAGDEVLITNLRGVYAPGVMVIEGKRAGVAPASAPLRVGQSEDHRPIEVDLICAVPRGDRLGMLIDMATQIGIRSFTPLKCEHSEPRGFPTPRVERRMIEACKQSRRFQLPIIHPQTTFRQAVEAADTQAQSVLRLIAHPRGKHLSERVAIDNVRHRAVIVLIGPEGGFSAEEVSTATDHGFTAVSLGEHILRIETAAIVALSLLTALED